MNVPIATNTHLNLLYTEYMLLVAIATPARAKLRLPTVAKLEGSDRGKS
ncbi:hypothetical protein [Chamaesiphon sp. GL140_3_metabinner_50]|nr:hypothetical protein [Chamaesiphon sp. GL140_3_metabinner_50]